VRVPVNAEKYITGAAWFLRNQKMHLINENFRVRDTNGRREQDPLWVEAHGLWILQDDRQVFGAFDCKGRVASVAISGPRWRTHLFVKWLAQYMADPPRIHGSDPYRHRWRVTYFQSTAPLDNLRVQK